MKANRLMLAFFCVTIPSYGLSDFDEKPIQISGMLFSKVFPGPPNFENIREGDRQETAWILTVAKKDSSEDFQLVPTNDDPRTLATLKKCQGKAIHVRGMMWLGHTGHHHTKYLITVASVSE